jgi:pimeloyl-ACP methyl ester carboxylesterase
MFKPSTFTYYAARLRSLCILMLCFSSAFSVASAQEKALTGFGIVLMHGKGGQPGGYIQPMALALEAEGALVVMPKMAWSGTKGRPDSYSVSYTNALLEIDRAIAQLKSQGATKIIVAGQSLGANAALGFAAIKGAEITGIVLLAAGHTPERVRMPEIATALASAQQLMSSGKGQEVADYPDFNQGKIFLTRATAEAYVSFFDPKGPAVMPTNASLLPSLPMLWVIGRRDGLVSAGRGYVFDRAPANKKSRYVEIDAGHIDTPQVAPAEVIAWLKTL